MLSDASAKVGDRPQFTSNVKIQSPDCQRLTKKMPDMTIDRFRSRRAVYYLPVEAGGDVTPTTQAKRAFAAFDNPTTADAIPASRI
jgi:hypothetical protein